MPGRKPYGKLFWMVFLVYFFAAAGLAGGYEQLSSRYPGLGDFLDKVRGAYNGDFFQKPSGSHTDRFYLTEVKPRPVRAEVADARVSNIPVPAQGLVVYFIPAVSRGYEMIVNSPHELLVVFESAGGTEIDRWYTRHGERNIDRPRHRRYQLSQGREYRLFLKPVKEQPGPFTAGIRFMMDRMSMSQPLLFILLICLPLVPVALFVAAGYYRYYKRLNRRPV